MGRFGQLSQYPVRRPYRPASPGASPHFASAGAPTPSSSTTTTPRANERIGISSGWSPARSCGLAPSASTRSPALVEVGSQTSNVLRWSHPRRQGTAHTTYGVTVIVPLSLLLTAVVRQAVGVAPASSGIGRLERTTGVPPSFPTDSAPPPVANSPGSQLAVAEAGRLLLDTEVWVRTTNADTDWTPSSAGLTASSLSLKAVRNLMLDPSAICPVAALR